MTSESPVFMLRSLLLKAARLVASRRIFVAFGACIAVPKAFLERIFSENDRLRDFAQAVESGGSLDLSFDVFFFVFLAFFALVVASFGALGIASFSNECEKKKKSPEGLLLKSLFQKIGRVVALEGILIVLAIFAGILLFLPSTLAKLRGLESLVQPLLLSGLGLLVSIAVLFFFLRQYSVLYVAISNIFVRSALENAAGIFRRYVRETLWIGSTLFACRLLGISLLLVVEFLLWSGSLFFWGAVPFAVVIFLWIFNVMFFSIFEAWNWIVWTLFFRSIALPSEREPALQTKESVLQQEGAIGLDKA